MPVFTVFNTFVLYKKLILITILIFTYWPTKKKKKGENFRIIYH